MNGSARKARALRRARIATWVCLWFLALEYLTGKWLILSAYQPPYGEAPFEQWAARLALVTDLHIAIAVVVLYAGVVAVTCGALAGLRFRVGVELAGGLLAVLASLIMGGYGIENYGFAGQLLVAAVWLAAACSYVVALIDVTEKTLQDKLKSTAKKRP